MHDYLKALVGVGGFFVFTLLSLSSIESSAEIGVSRDLKNTIQAQINSTSYQRGVDAPALIHKVGGKPIKSAPIYPKFVSAAKACGCSPGRIGTWGLRGNRSCHPSGHAIDVFSINCGGKTYNAGTQKFGQFVKCIDGRKGWFKLYHQCVKGLPKNDTTCHRDHAHFSMGCSTPEGKAW